MQTTSSPRRIVVFILVILFSVLLAVFASASYTGSTQKSPATSGNQIGATAPPLYVWNLGTNVSLTQATQEVGFKVAVPTYLPQASRLSEVRILPGGESVMLGYTNPNLSSVYGNSQGLGIVILEETSAGPPSNLPPITIQTTYPNGTAVTVTSSQSLSMSPSTVIDGKNVVTAETNGLSSATWWSNGVFYQLTSSLPLNDLVQVAQSMGL